MKDLFVIIIAAIALIYIERMRHLQYGEHPFSLVTQHVLGASICIYSAFHTWEFGIQELPLMASAMAGLCLFTSREVCRLIKPEKRVMHPGLK